MNSIFISFSFFLSKSFRSVLSIWSIWPFKIFSPHSLSMNFCFSITKCFLYPVGVLILSTVCFFKWLWMLWMCIELLISGFSVDSCLKSAVLIFIYQFVQKLQNYILLCEILCSNLTILCLLFNDVRIYVVFQIMPWKYLCMLGHRFVPIAHPIICK